MQIAMKICIDLFLALAVISLILQYAVFIGNIAAKRKFASKARFWAFLIPFGMIILIAIDIYDQYQNI